MFWPMKKSNYALKHFLHSGKKIKIKTQINKLKTTTTNKIKYSNLK